MRIEVNDVKFYTLKPENLKRSRAGFLSSFREPVQRIDYTQHCLSAYLQKLVDIDEKPIR
jgi:hypothetical protein|tara:strand:+ start:567 stop:746 length:180 start_codon:yes stop_codon:yes gene_type:complete